LDRDYVLLGLVLAFIGVTGLTATWTLASPAILIGVTCNCIPSPASRIQELSGMLLVFGLAFVPVGFLMHPATSSENEGPLKTGSGRVIVPLRMRSKGLLVAGVVLDVLAINLVIVPDLLLLGNAVLLLEGIVLAGMGAVFAYQGTRPE